MNLTFATLVQRAIASVISPRPEARWLLSTFDMPREARWLALVLTVVLSVIVAQVGLFFVPLATDMPFAQILTNPFLSTIAQTSLLILMVFVIFFVGRAMGGIGGFGNTILVVAWVQFIMTVLQSLQTVALMVSAPLASILGVISFVIFFRVLTSFIAELHGFKSLLNVFVMILVTMVGLTFGVSILLAIIGVSIPGAV